MSDPIRAATTVLAAALMAAAGPAAPARAQQEAEGARPDSLATPLLEALESHRHPLALEDGELTGAGAELLLRGAREARYLLVGETHGVAEAPLLVAALFRELRPHGYRHLAVEIGPVQARRIGEILAGPRPLEGYRAFLREHWPAVPFYPWRTEAEMLAAVVEATGEASALWGVDYDVLGDRYPLHRLRELAPDPEARAAAERRIERADSLLRRARASGDLSTTMMFSEPASTWAELRDAYDPVPGSEADRILTQLEATARINEAWTSGERLTSNVRRVRLLKHNFLRHRASADPGAKVIVKMGAYHAMRGRTFNNTFDLGNFLSELGLAESGPAADDPTASHPAGSFHVLVAGGPGRQRGALDPRDWGVRTVPTVLSAEGHWSHPLGEVAHGDRWTVLDLRPLRPLADADELGELPPDLERVIFAYDAVVVLVGNTAAEPLVEPPR